MSDAAAQLRRILHLIPRLADDREHPVADIADALGIGRDTLLKDLRSLAERFDDPAGFVEGVSIYIENDRVSVHASHFLRPMRLTRAELAALELGLAMLRAERPPEEHRAIDGARARLRTVLATLVDADGIADGIAELRSADLGAPADAALLAACRHAVRDHRKLAIDYRKTTAADAEPRTVRPYALVPAQGAWYLVAHCERSDGIRIFRVDRIASAELGRERYAIPAAFVLDDYVRDGRVFHADEPQALTVRYSPTIARWIAEHERKPLDADGSLTVIHPMADLDWAVRHVLQYGPDAEVLEPAAVREAVRARLAAMLGE